MAEQGIGDDVLFLGLTPEADEVKTFKCLCRSRLVDTCGRS